MMSDFYENISISVNQFEQFFHKNYKKLCLVAVQYVKNPDLAKDLVQEFFLYVWNRREEIHLSDSFEAYAYRSVKNICITHLKRQKRHVVFLGDELPEMGFDPVGLLEDEQIKTDMHAKLKEALSKLPTECRRIFLLSNVQGLTYAEIAVQNNISINTVKTQIKRAYVTLRSEFSAKTLLLLLMFFLSDRI